MHLDDHIRQVHHHLTATAALGDERTQQVADALASAAVPAVRLALIGALSAAADEITAALLDAPGSPTVAVRLDGDDVRVDVTLDTSEAAAPPADEGEASARISLRLSEALKSEIERAAGEEGVSVNTWLVRAAGNALRGNRGGWPPRADWPGPGGHGGHGRARNVRRVTGWIDG